MEFLQSFPRRHFAGKPVVASRNVGCFLRQEWWSMSGSVIDAQTTDKTRKTISFQLRSYLGLPYLLFVLLIKVFSSFCLTYEVSDSASSSSTQWTYALLKCFPLTNQQINTQFRFLRNCPPTPPLSQYFSQNEKC